MMQNADFNVFTYLRVSMLLWLAYLLLLVVFDGVVFMDEQAFHIYFLVFGSGVAAFVVGLTYWTALQRVMGKWFLPFTIVAMVGLTLLSNHAMRQWMLPGTLLAVPTGATLRMLPLYLMGLILVAWQYSWRWVVIYSLGLSCADILMIQISASNPEAIFVALIEFACLFVVGLFINALVEQLQTRERELVIANQQLADYMLTQETLTLSQERNRLAREMHDTVAHTLSGLSVQLEAANAYWDVDAETTQQLVSEAHHQAQSGLEETRRALRALRASPLDDLGLSLAIAQLAEDAAKRGSLTLQLDRSEHIPPLVAGVEQCVYRIAQEAITNVVLHANAQKLMIELVWSEADNLLQLAVVDDGIGFDAAQDFEGHYGLAGMRERAEMARGILAIESRPGEGTSIEFTV